MTQTLEPASDTDAAGSSPQARVDAWFAEFEAALAARDVEKAAGLFATESFWRVLIALSWHFTTLEHRDGVK